MKIKIISIEKKEKTVLEGKPYSVFTYEIICNKGKTIIRAFCKEEPKDIVVGNEIEILDEKQTDKFSGIQFYKYIRPQKDGQNNFKKGGYSKPEITINNYMELVDACWQKAEHLCGGDPDKKIVAFEKILGVASVMNIKIDSGKKYDEHGINDLIDNANKDLSNELTGFNDPDDDIEF